MLRALVCAAQARRKLGPAAATTLVNVPGGCVGRRGVEVRGEAIERRPTATRDDDGERPLGTGADRFIAAVSWHLPLLVLLLALTSNELTNTINTGTLPPARAAAAGACGCLDRTAF